MIPSRIVDSTAKNTQTDDWDLTSSATGTVKRRPSSLESCKSSSPTTTIDFPIDSHKKNDIVVGASCKTNKLLESGGETEEIFDLSHNFFEESSGKNDVELEKIDFQKKRFFDIKFGESAKKSLASKLKLPNRVSLTISPQKPSTSPARNKLSVSQLEQQNNLFIRDGQQQQLSDNNGRSDEKINKHKLPTKAKNNKIFESQGKQKDLNDDIVMEKPENNDTKQKQQGTAAKNKKSSLIPSFLGGNGKNTNHIKIPSTSESARKASSTTVVGKLTKTGNKFKELYRDFPSTSNSDKTTVPPKTFKRNPPPYRPPPTPPSLQGKQVEKQRRIRFTEGDEENYEEIDEINDENVDGSVSKSSSNNDDISNVKAEDITVEAGEETDSMMSKAEYSSNVFKNIPVRQKKGAVSHMENYCLFDPSVDFCNEKELVKKKLMQSRMSGVSKKKLPVNIENEESIEDVTFEDQTVYDVSELDEREKLLAHHNYYEIDPDLLLEEDENEMNRNKTTVELEHVQIDRNHTVKEKRSQSVASKNRKSKIYCNTLSTSSESTSTSSNSSATTTSSDYPSLFNSVIETTHSSNLESTTDDNDSNGYGKVTNSGQARMNNSHCGDMINQVTANAVSNESVIRISNVVTCGESNASSTGATKKKSPQLIRIIRPSSSSSTRNMSLSNSHLSNKQQTSSLATKLKSTRINLPFYKKSIQLDPLKSSHSLPHLQNVTVQNRCRQQNNEFNVLIDNTTTIQLRRQHSSKQQRPLSVHSDDRDSGFLSPVTPPDNQNHPTHITPNVIIQQSEQNTKTESTLLNQCDNIQQLIEVSNNKLLSSYV